MSSSQCISIAPTKKSDSEERIRAAITCSSILPPPGISVTSSNEIIEKRHLSSALGWRNPQGLFGYSKDSDYKDLYVYFDYADKTSPVNELATKAFSMYGLGGAQVFAAPTWESIRGPVVLVRIEPDYSFSPDSIFRPTITVDEMYDTLIFFRDSKKSAYKIAVKRDSVRMAKSVPFPFGSTGPGMAYMGSGFRAGDKMKQDLDVCDHCGKTQAVAGKLKQCQRCKVTLYCGKDCQKSAWKKHKKVCHTL